MEKNRFTLKTENTENTDNHYQLSFDDFSRMATDEKVISRIPYVDYLLIDGKEFTFPKHRYFILSLLIHSVLFATILFYSFNPEWLPQKTEDKNLITFTIESTAESSMGMSGRGHLSEPAVTIPQPPPAPQSKATTTATAPVKPTTNEETIVIPTAQVHRPKPTGKTPVETFDETPAQIDDIVVPDLAQVNEDVPQSNETPNFDEIKNKFDEIDAQDSSKIVAANQELDQLSSESLNAIEDQSSQIQEQNSHLDTLAEKRKNQLAQEKQQLALAAQKAKGNGRPNSAPEQSEEVGNGLAGSGHGDSIGGAATSSEGAGTGTGNIRQLEDLKQMPGNLKPQYDIEDRVKGLSGSIVLYGFVTKEGSLSAFKMIQSTGHRSLDRKTLQALKKWKFYPGQEGWVELPFKWDLKGGVQQKPTLLKRR